MTLDIRLSPVGGETTPIRVVTLEEHFSTADFLKATEPFVPVQARSDMINQRLLDLDDGRLKAMDEGGVDTQVLSLADAGLEGLSAADATAVVRDTNDVAYAATLRHPGRLRMFASLSLRQPEAAAAELVRGVRELGCVGGFVNGTEGGSFLDDPRYAPVFEAAQDLDVPIYLHPSPPQAAVRDAYFGGLPDRSAYFLSTAAWGWHAELGMHCLRMILGGVFDRHPELKVIIGHLGENLPYSLVRAQDGLPQSVTGLDRSITEYFATHFWVTTSGYFTLPPVRCALDVVGVDRLLYSVDYPYRSNDSGAELLRTLPLAHSDLRRIAGANADLLLRL